MARRNKVLFVIDTLEIGGAEQSLLANAARFTELNPIVCHLFRGDTLKPAFLQHGIKVYSLNINRRYGFIAAFKGLSTVLEQERPDLLVACLTRSELVSRFAGKKFGVPVIGSFVSDLYGKAHNQHLSFKAKMLVAAFRLLNKWTAPMCAGFVANSQAVKESNANRLAVPLQKVVVINRGRDKDLFTIKDRYEDSLRFVSVGRLIQSKAQNLLIRAFAGFSKVHGHARLDIVGAGPEAEALQNLIRMEGMTEKIKLLGKQNNIPGLLAQYDCFVFPSLSEGFSGALVEAHFAGLPILASDIPANREVVTQHETGMLFESGSAFAIEQALHWFVANREKAAQMAREGNQFALQHFDLLAVVGRFEKYLTHCITARK